MVVNGLNSLIEWQGICIWHHSKSLQKINQNVTNAQRKLWKSSKIL
jgi:hypothetical protein